MSVSNLHLSVCRAF